MSDFRQTELRQLRQLVGDLVSTAQTTPAPVARAAAARQRLDRLDNFLREDPANTALRIDAFETALSCGEWERAQQHLQSGLASDEDPWGWKLREGDFWLAQQRFDEARGVLEALASAAAAPAGFERVVIHNLAYVDMRQGRLTACVDRLAPLLEGTALADAVTPTTSTAERALQQLWLRALHHHGELARAVAWATAAEQSQQLDPQAAGIASLIALDAGDVAAARRWSAACLSHSTGQDRPTEALATQASLALAERDAQRARHYADQALALSPSDGRAWSTRAFADMLAGGLDAARTAFQQAVTFMPTHIGTWHGKGWAELMQGDLAAAQASFEAALALDRNFAESHGGLAVVLAMQQQADAAQGHAERARRIDPTNLSGRYAEALLSGHVKAGADMQRLARRLLGERTGLLGEAMRGWLP